VSAGALSPEEGTEVSKLVERYADAAEWEQVRRAHQHLMRGDHPRVLPEPGSNAEPRTAGK
jgi:hypothetical protein